MRIERILALTLAGVMTASLLTGCPQQQGGPDASPSSSSSSRPHHTGSDDDSGDDTSSSEPEEIPEKGYEVVEGTYHVYTAEGLKAWVSNPNVQGTNCTLEDDIKLEGEWEPISSYAGIFDGQGHTISSLKVTGTGQFMSDTNGMFGEITGGCVKNLRLENPVVTRMKDFGFGGLIPPDANNGAIAGKLHGGQIIECTVSNATIYGSDAGGLVGETQGSDNKMIGCVVTSSTIIP